MPDPIIMEPRMDLSNVEPFVQSMMLQAAEGQIVLDASKVTHLGALCTQAIISAARTVGNAGGTLKITSLSDRAAQQLEYMGLTKDILVEGAR